MASNGFVGRKLLFMSIIAFMALFTIKSFARDIVVFDVRKNIPLTDQETVFKDFYLNGGFQEGFKKGLVVNVTRRITVNDSTQNQSAGELIVTVGKLKIIHVQKNMSVGRLVSVESPEDIPILDYDTVMSGDVVDMSTAIMDKGEKKSATAEPESKSFIDEKGVMWERAAML